MAIVEYDQGRADIARATLTCGWAFTGLATISVTVMFLSHRRSQLSFGWDHAFVLCAYIISLVSVAQTSWAVIDEGQGKHFPDMDRPTSERIARVCEPFQIYVSNQNRVQLCSR